VSSRIARGSESELTVHLQELSSDYLTFTTVLKTIADSRPFTSLRVRYSRPYVGASHL